VGIVSRVEWVEVARDVYLGAYEPLTINICVIRDRDRLVVVDSRASATEGAQLVADLTWFAPARVQALINTHAHFDHTFGNQHFGYGSATAVPIYGHHLLPAHLDQYEGPRLEAWRSGSGNEPTRDWDDIVITPPTHLVRIRQQYRLGARRLELIPLPPGHTDTDLVVHVPDADTWVVGDVIEASGPPMFGSGCYPLEFPGSLRGLLSEISPADTIVPGHGPLVDLSFAVAQLKDIADLATRLRALHRSKATQHQAFTAIQAVPSVRVDGLALAVARAYSSLASPASATPPRSAFSS
jgi:glyoxylase-like metal-dependent hydrolase (beta-lactamase superfamily II)